MLLSQNGFALEKEGSKQSLPKVTSEESVSRRSLKQVFLEICQYSQESICDGVSLMKFNTGILL